MISQENKGLQEKKGTIRQIIYAKKSSVSFLRQITVLLVGNLGYLCKDQRTFAKTGYISTKATVYVYVWMCGAGCLYIEM